MGIHGSQSGSLHLNIEFDFDVDDESWFCIGTAIIFVIPLISNIVSSDIWIIYGIKNVGFEQPMVFGSIICNMNILF